MTIEENIFKRAEVNEKALAGYGFRHSKESWTLEVPFMNGDFKAVITVDGAGHILGDVFETATQDIFLPLRVESSKGELFKIIPAACKLLCLIKPSILLAKETI